MRKPIWDILSEQKKKECLDDIIGYFLDERDEKIGVIAAEQVLDLLLEKLVMAGYEKGVEDSKKLLQQKMGDIELDLELLGNRD